MTVFAVDSGRLEGRLVVGPGAPDNSLPGSQPGIDNSLPSVPGPVDPGYGYPMPPVVSHPIVRPGHPSTGPVPPTYPVDPDYDLPIPPTVWPRPPHYPDNSLPVVPVSPNHDLPIYQPAPGAPNHDLPLPPGSVWPPLPPSITGTVMALVWIVGAGYRWTVIDTSLKPSHPIEIIPPSTVPGVPTHPISGGGQPSHPIAPGGSGGRPSQPIQPTPAPKTS